MAECKLADDLLDNEEIVAKVKKFLEEGCKCSQGVKGGYCSQQFQKEVVLSNLKQLPAAIAWRTPTSSFWRTSKRSRGSMSLGIKESEVRAAVFFT